MSFYAYMWLREDGSPYYVGKGMGNRAYTKSAHRIHPPKDRSRVLIFPRTSEQEAFDTETELIRNWGRKDIGTGILRNMSDGGEGSSGYKHTEKARQKMVVARVGKKPALGMKHSAESKAKLQMARQGKKPALGSKHTDEWKAAQAERIRNSWTPERRAAQAERTSLMNKERKAA